MEYIKREDFVNKTNAKIFVNNKFIETLNELKKCDFIKSYDGKTINKRFTDKVNAVLPKGMTIGIKKEGYTEECYIYLYLGRYGDNDIFSTITDPILAKEIRNLNYYDCEDRLNKSKPNIYNSKDSIYLEDRKFQYEQFINSIDNRIELLTQNNKDSQRAVDEVDITYQKYEDMKKYVEEVMKTIPSPLKTFISIQNPLY